jgi:hypothetical protein
MFGQPGEDRTTLQDSVNLIKDISYGEYRAQKIFGCVPFPGTGLYDWCKEQGRIKDDQDFYDRYICKDWSLDQIPINMTDLPDAEVNRLFKEANGQLSSFYLEKMASDWVAHFRGGEFVARVSSGALTHIRERVEASANTYDTSGKT